VVTKEILSFIKENVAFFTTWSPSETKGVFKGHDISVMLHDKELFLYIDGHQADKQRTYLWPKKDAVLLRGIIKKGKKTHSVEVYGRSGLFEAKIKICVDGAKVGGSDF
jgi:hypothetical protein